jgi:lipopolysaccharide transport system ATP-binding protein
MRPLVRFEQVSKRYRAQRDHPRSFREWFTRRRPRGGTDTSRIDWRWALREVSFTIAPGETVGLIGSNGAGKSTLLKLISQIISPSSGQVEVNGRVRALLELGTGFHPELSGRDNIFLSGALAGMSRAQVKQKYRPIVEFSELAEFMEMPVKHYSSGMFARLAFAVSIHLEPDILLVDEVLAVGDQAFQQKCLDRIGELQRQGVTICLVTHSLDLARARCSRALWIEHGHLRADGPTERVAQQYLDHVLGIETDRLARSSELDSAQRWGNRRLEIVGVRITDARGVDRRIFQTGEALAIHLDYRIHQPTPAPVFGLAIHRHDGLHICGPNTRETGVSLAPSQAGGTITYTVPDLLLLEGLYQISVAAVDQADTETYDYHDRAYSFRVINRYGNSQERYGVISLGGEWSFNLPSPSEPHSLIRPPASSANG